MATKVGQHGKAVGLRKLIEGRRQGVKIFLIGFFGAYPLIAAVILSNTAKNPPTIYSDGRQAGRNAYLDNGFHKYLRD
jgi:hypothetical protein